MDMCNLQLRERQPGQGVHSQSGSEGSSADVAPVKPMLPLSSRSAERESPLGEQVPVVAQTPIANEAEPQHSAVRNSSATPVHLLSDGDAQSPRPSGAESTAAAVQHAPRVDEQAGAAGEPSDSPAWSQHAAKEQEAPETSQRGKASVEPPSASVADELDAEACTDSRASEQAEEPSSPAVAEEPEVEKQAGDTASQRSTEPGPSPDAGNSEAEAYSSPVHVSPHRSPREGAAVDKGPKDAPEASGRDTGVTPRLSAQESPSRLLLSQHLPSTAGSFRSPFSHAAGGASTPRSAPAASDVAEPSVTPELSSRGTASFGAAPPRASEPSPHQSADSPEVEVPTTAVGTGTPRHRKLMRARMSVRVTATRASRFLAARQSLLMRPSLARPRPTMGRSTCLPPQMMPLPAEPDGEDDFTVTLPPPALRASSLAPARLTVAPPITEDLASHALAGEDSFAGSDSEAETVASLPEGDEQSHLAMLLQACGQVRSRQVTLSKDVRCPDFHAHHTIHPPLLFAGCGRGARSRVR